MKIMNHYYRNSWQNICKAKYSNLYTYAIEFQNQIESTNVLPIRRQPYQADYSC